MNRFFSDLWPLTSGLLFLALLFSLPARAEDADTRYQALISELRCLVCQNQIIAESNAPLAADLRAQVKAQIAAGRSDEQVVDYLTARYGDFVRYRPAFKARTWLLWLGPFAVLLGAALAAAMVIRRSRTAAPAPRADPAALKALLEKEQGPR